MHSDAVKRALNKTASPLSALDTLKKICDHPALLSKRAVNTVIHGRDFYGDVGDEEDDCEETEEEVKEESTLPGSDGYEEVGSQSAQLCGCADCGVHLRTDKHVN